MSRDTIQIRITGNLEELETALEKLSRVFTIVRRSDPFRQQRNQKTILLYNLYCDVDLENKPKEAGE